MFLVMHTIHSHLTFLSLTSVFVTRIPCSSSPSPISYFADCAILAAPIHYSPSRAFLRLYWFLVSRPSSHPLPHSHLVPVYGVLHTPFHLAVSHSCTTNIPLRRAHSGVLISHYYQIAALCHFHSHIATCHCSTSSPVLISKARV